jgi:hypothetical protein
MVSQNILIDLKSDNRGIKKHLFLVFNYYFIFVKNFLNINDLYRKNSSLKNYFNLI